jgi:hypothetical protein
MTGLRRLAAQGTISLRRVLAANDDPAYERYTNWWRVTDRAQSLSWNVCLDFGDDAAVTSERARAASLTFKRSLDPALVPDDLTNPVLPLGLIMDGCDPGLQSLAESMTAAVVAAVRGEDERRSAQWRMRVLAVHGRQSLRWRRAGQPDCPGPRPFSTFELAPDSHADARIFYVTRAWQPRTPGGEDDRTEVSDGRATLIRTLRNAFGRRATAGFIPDEWTSRRYPDCVLDRPLSGREYVDAVRNHAIAVSSIGLHRSTPFKLPEFLAASRAVVTDPPRSVLPRRLVDGTEVLTFETPDECATQCELLLREPELVHLLRKAAAEYHATEIRPDVLVLNRLLDVSAQREHAR